MSDLRRAPAAFLGDRFAGRRYAVFGLARSGVATVRALLAAGAEVVAWDSDPAACEALLAEIEDAGDALEIRNFVERGALDGFEALVVSPGVPLNRHPIAGKAHAWNLPVIGDIELFAEARADLPRHKVVGITGTNGKSTVTALIHHVLREAGWSTTLGGNIGLPILGQQPLPAGGVYVLELSSYQIDLTHSLDCDVAVLLNITPDHLDRYDGFKGYAASKARLLAMQDADHVAVIAVEDDATRAIAVAERTRRAAARHRIAMVRRSDAIGQKAWPALQGPHNAQNAAAAIAALRALELPEADIARGLATYPGLPHRMERVGERHGILFVNDSKATNAASVAPALAAFEGVHWILGGIAKTPDLEACLPFLPHVRAAYTIGQSGDMLADILDPALPVIRAGTLDAAVEAAAAAARPGEVVMLSPACASFDQYRDFEHRGQAFRDAVAALP
ncbi:MAG: UDP-N-acetylmuramoyl-L-alanine--D-glutamate ligase [Sphingomonas fennica]